MADISDGTVGERPGPDGLGLGDPVIPGPRTRVVELRIHGIMGITAEVLTDSVATVEVAGDAAGQIVQPADRLRRPAPGPILHAGGTPVPRVVEGYLWSRMTSGGLAKATWALLFPFSLANVAHWMLPPVPTGSRLGRTLALLLRTLLRLAAVLLTMLLVSQLAVISLDLLAAQCLTPRNPCLHVVPEWWRELPYFRPLVGLLPIAGLVYVLHEVSTVDWSVAVDARPEQSPAAGPPRLPGDGLAADPDTPALRNLHCLAALSCVSLLALGGPFGRTGSPAPALWVAAVVLLGLAVLGVVLLDDPSAPHLRPGPLHRVLVPVIRRLMRWGGTILLLGTVVVIEPLRTPADLLHGSDTMVESIGALLVAVCVAVGALLVPAALLARVGWSRLPSPLRPWAGGWMAAPVLVLGCLTGGGFGAGVAITVRNLLGQPGLRLPASYDEVTLLWGAGAVLAAAAVALTAPVVVFVRWLYERRGTLPTMLALLHDGRTADAKAAVRAWWRAKFEREHAQHVLLAMFTVLSVGAPVALVIRIERIPLPEWASLVSGFGVAALAGLAIWLLRKVYLAAKQPTVARRLGALSDIAAFWPREAHPIVPPCYALKVVPEVAARVVEHLADPNTRVVVIGHSQGSLIAAVAVARVLDKLPESERHRVGLVTVGSQLQWAYPRAFPAVVSHQSLARLSGMLGGRWRALCRGTDPLGGPVCTWDRQVYAGRLLGAGYRPDGSSGPLPPAVRTPTGALVLGSDHWLPDPARGPFPGHRWHPGVLGHADFSFDPEWDHAVAIAAGLEPPPTTENGSPTTSSARRRSPGTNSGATTSGATRSDATDTDATDTRTAGSDTKSSGSTGHPAPQSNPAPQPNPAHAQPPES